MTQAGKNSKYYNDMNSFPTDIKFKYKWRPYQKRVLDELNSHLSDRKLHVVAAPGAGKTVLGLEAILRINQSTLILSPTIAIRNQWKARFIELFLGNTSDPEWLSTDINNPSFLTISTYQGLYSIMNGIEFSEEDELKVEEAEEENTSYKNNKINISNNVKNYSQLIKTGIKTIVVDEAHHLRREWWKSLNKLISQLNDPIIVALTATPPYDVPLNEWKKYEELCGPIDAQVSVPELVKEKNLCPHQDYIYFSKLSAEEQHITTTFRTEISNFFENILSNKQLVNEIKNHCYILNPTDNIELILHNVEYYSSMLIFLNNYGITLQSTHLKVLGAQNKTIPNITLDWCEILMNNILFTDSASYNKNLIIFIKKELKIIGAIERKNVFLNTPKYLTNLIKNSIQKLNSIAEITAFETRNLNNNLRMLILSDYIRRDFMPKDDKSAPALNKLGVLPIFEFLRRKNNISNKLGVLSGTLVIIPASVKCDFVNIANKYNVDEAKICFMPYIGDITYFIVTIKGQSGKKIVSIITKLFEIGRINILVGTKSLLGEGWDAPCINSLILASFVGSYMLSNQMRGRAIRIDSNNPQKTANIWHLVAIDPKSKMISKDYSDLKRRFECFVGVSNNSNSIENGIERLNIQYESQKHFDLRESNLNALTLAADRAALPIKWNRALSLGTYKFCYEEVRSEKKLLPRAFVFCNTIKYLLFMGIFSGILCCAESLNSVGLSYRRFDTLITVFLAGSLVGCVITIPFLIKALILFCKHGPIASSMREVGKCVLETLYHIKTIKTDKTKVDLNVSLSKEGVASCYLKGATPYEQSVFNNTMYELLSAIDNPRYLLIRSSIFYKFGRKDYLAIPNIIGCNKQNVVFFTKEWKKHIGKANFIYTRSIEGRACLVKARFKSLSSNFVKKANLKQCWK